MSNNFNTTRSYQASSKARRGPSNNRLLLLCALSVLLAPWYDLAMGAQSGDSEADSNPQVQHGEPFHLTNVGLPDNATEAARLSLEAANHGSADAADHLVAIYELGLGVPPSRSDAILWLKRAASERLAEGSAASQGSTIVLQFYLARQRFHDAADWLIACADAGVIDCQFQLAEAYRTGQSAWIPADYPKAMDWLVRVTQNPAWSVFHGKAGVRSMIGKMYLSGAGVVQDSGQAERWLLDAGDGDSLLQVYKLRTHGASPQIAGNAEMPLLIAAADAGSANAQHDLAQRYLDGRGVPVSVDRAMAYRLKGRHADMSDANDTEIFGPLLDLEETPDRRNPSTQEIRVGAATGDPVALERLALSYFDRNDNPGYVVAIALFGFVAEANKPGRHVAFDQAVLDGTHADPAVEAVIQPLIDSAHQLQTEMSGPKGVLASIDEFIANNR